jgi:hypothetical protein
MDHRGTFHGKGRKRSGLLIGWGVVESQWSLLFLHFRKKMNRNWGFFLSTLLLWRNLDFAAGNTQVAMNDNVYEDEVDPTAT